MKGCTGAPLQYFN